MFDDTHPGLPALALVDRQVQCEGVDGIQADPGPRPDDLGPVVATRGILRGFHQPEVLGSVIGHDQESGSPSCGRVAPVVVDAVLDPLATGLDDREVTGRVVCI